MKVFGVGLGKTGTTTLGVCLETLGYEVKGLDLELTKHMAQENWGPLFQVADRHSGFQDFPWPLVYEEMDERYPNSKFVLTVRKNSETWFRSLRNQAYRSGAREQNRLTYGYEMPFGLKKEHTSFYERHNERVRTYFQGREDDLLEVCWETGDGWREVCDFLDHDVPNEPFPHINKSPSQAKIYWQKTKGKIRKILNRILGDKVVLPPQT